MRTEMSMSENGEIRSKIRFNLIPWNLILKLVILLCKPVTVDSTGDFLLLLRRRVSIVGPFVRPEFPSWKTVNFSHLRPPLRMLDFELVCAVIQNSHRDSGAA